VFDNPGLTLSTTPASTPADIFWPYLGDYSKVPQLQKLPLSTFVVKESQEFIDDFGKGERRADSYPELIRELLKSFRATAEAQEKDYPDLEKEVHAMEENLRSLNALEKAHRQYLLKLAGLSR